MRGSSYVRTDGVSGEIGFVTRGMRCGATLDDMGLGRLPAGIMDGWLWSAIVDALRARTLAEAEAAGRARVVFRYASRPRAIAILVARAEEMLTEGKPAVAEQIPGPAGCAAAAPRCRQRSGRAGATAARHR